MAEIKSAYERAMERFQDVAPDRNALKNKETKDRGKQFCAKVLLGESISVKAELSKLSSEMQLLFKQGIAEIIIARISLPNSEQDIENIEKIKPIATEISSDAGTVEDILTQYHAMCGDYFENKTVLTEQMKEQYMKFMQQQGQQSAQIEESFIQQMQQKIKSFDEQYLPTIAQVKASLRELLGLPEDEESKE